MAALKNKGHMLALIRKSKIPEEEKRAFLAELVRTGQVTEDDLARSILEDVRTNFEDYKQQFASDEMLTFLWERFKDHPEMLARALVKARPDIFYVYGLAIRLVLKLRAELGKVLVKPKLGNGGGVRDIAPSPKLPQAVSQDIIALDVECRFRESLFFFSRDVEIGREFIREELGRAKGPYERQVWEGVQMLVAQLLDLPYPGVKTELNGKMFPAMHVRWWHYLAADLKRVLNIGDTGSYKTSFAAIAMRRAGCRRTLVLAAPHARENWRRELGLYFEERPSVQIVSGVEDVDDLHPEADFVVIGYSTLVEKGVVEKLIAQKFDGLIEDECHYTRNVVDSPAKRALARMRLVQELPLDRYLALSATPWENRPEEMASLASALRPDLFPTPEVFLGSGAASSPRLMRELFAGQILDIELREVTDMPEITPKPWEDLCPSVTVRPNRQHLAFYRRVLDDEEESLEPHQKVQRLLMAAIHPPLLARKLKKWTDPPRANDWKLSSKLVWLKQFVTERIGTQKIVIASGLYASGITHPSEMEDMETEWVGGILRAWFGKETVVTIDDTVGLGAPEGGLSPRDRAIQRWRTDPSARILLISSQSCPDSVNLSVGKLPGVEGLAITFLSFGWKPWKQFLGRFFRYGQGVPITFVYPVVAGTIDEDLLRLNREKWQAQLLFRAGAPLTDDEWRALQSENGEAIQRLMRDASDHVAILFNQMRGEGERACREILDQAYGAVSAEEALAMHFLAAQDYSMSGHISRFQKTVIEQWIACGLITPTRILDAGCGPLTLERRLFLPVYGVDLNRHMLELGSGLSSHHGVNATVGRLSELPSEWKGKFELTVATMVLDLTSLKEPSHGEPERVRILQELVRVTDPHSLVWLTWSYNCHTPETFQAWVEALEQAGCKIRSELTGLVQATDHEEQPCEFWSLAFSPHGKTPTFVRPELLRFAFEIERMKDRKGGVAKPPKPPKTKRRVAHERFAVTTATGQLTDVDAAKAAALNELLRWMNAGVQTRKLHPATIDLAAHFARDWRVLRALQEQGLITL